MLTSIPGLKGEQVTFADRYSNQRYHESLGNLIPADVYFGRDQQILRQREAIKRRTILKRRLSHQDETA
ncbi:MAG: hypothetical protein NXH82_09805 [Rhodobacteraceae bacterium]|nr:hypothetical protein [Paracoccaceae bacterium]